jgi:hypothetical protein
VLFGKLWSQLRPMKAWWPGINIQRKKIIAIEKWLSVNYPRFF